MPPLSISYTCIKLLMAEGLTKPDIKAAQQLVQLSGGEDEEEECGCQNGNDSERKEKEKRDQDETSRVNGHVVMVERERKRRSALVEDGGDERRPSKRQRFLSLVYIYKVTQPVATSSK